MRALRLLGAWAVVNVLLLTPGWVLEGEPSAPWLALEAAALVGVFAVLPRRRWVRGLAWVAAGLTLAITLLLLADVAARMSLARPLNIYLDVKLLTAVFHLLSGTVGPWLTALGTLVVSGAVAATVWLLATLLAPLHGADPAAEAPLRVAPRIAGVAAIGLVTVGLSGQRFAPANEHLTRPVVQLATEQTTHLFRMLDERERFQDEMDASPANYAQLPGLLSGLEGRNVLLAFIESYGISALEDPRYAPVILPRLEDMERRFEEAGLYVVSGTLEAPIQGGQSWLGHGSLMGGLWLENQLRYDLLLASGRETLVDDFRRAGYRTFALMPAITMAWPEGERFGYDRIYAHEDIGYQGPPLNWVTMPDQFTWWFLEQEILASRGDAPLFVKLALISSHAPWTPILPVLDEWEEIGDGSIFAPWEDAGEPPSELWRDTDRVRDHFALQVEYAVHAMIAYAERFLDSGTLLIALGDHQPAPLITGDDASLEVPVHVISREPSILEPFLQWGFQPGALPPEEREIRGMNVFRDWFVRTYTPPSSNSSTSSQGPSP